MARSVVALQSARVWPVIRQSASLTCSQRPSMSTRAMPIGALANALSNRACTSCSPRSAARRSLSSRPPGERSGAESPDVAAACARERPRAASVALIPDRSCKPRTAWGSRAKPLRRKHWRKVPPRLGGAERRSECHKGPTEATWSGRRRLIRAAPLAPQSADHPVRRQQTHESIAVHDEESRREVDGDPDHPRDLDVVRATAHAHGLRPPVRRRLARTRCPFGWLRS